MVCSGGCWRNVVLVSGVILKWFVEVWLCGELVGWWFACGVACFCGFGWCL